MGAERTNDWQSRFDWGWAVLWTLVFVANLPVPVLCAGMFVAPDGWFGLCGGLAVLFWVGFALCLFRFRVGRSLVWGGGIIALSQMFPVLQLFCGAFGLGMWETIGGQRLLRDEDFHGPEPGWQGDQNIAALTVVFFTAHPLLVIAVLIGAFARWVGGDRPIWFTRRPDSDAEPVEG